MDSKAWELVLAVGGSGVISGFLVWVYNTVKNSGVKDFKSDDLFERVGLIETRQESHEEEYHIFREQIQTEFSSMEKKISDTNRDLEMRLTKMEIDLSHIKEMQVIQHQAQVETSKDIKQLLSRTTKG